MNIYITSPIICCLLLAITFLPLNCIAQPETLARRFPSLKEKSEKSDAIIEGQVTNLECFEGPNGRIYTSATIRASKIFLGNLSDSLVELIYIGGTINDRSYVVSHAFSITTGSDGLFFLKNNNTTLHFNLKVNSYVPSNGPYCYIQYHHDLGSHKATTQGAFYDSLEENLFQKNETVTRTSRKVLRPNGFGQ